MTAAAATEPEGEETEEQRGDGNSHFEVDADLDAASSTSFASASASAFAPASSHGGEDAAALEFSAATVASAAASVSGGADGSAATRRRGRYVYLIEEAYDQRHAKGDEPGPQLEGRTAYRRIGAAAGAGRAAARDAAYDADHTADGQRDEVPSSPSEGIWRTDRAPVSIDEPLLLLDEEEVAEHRRTVALCERLEVEAAEARAASKADRAALEALSARADSLERDRSELTSKQRRLEQENDMLRLQLQDHHGIMAADWAQTLNFQERLRDEEAAKERLAQEVAELRDASTAQAAEIAALRRDAGRWRLLCEKEGLQTAEADELDSVLEAAVPGVALAQAEASRRRRAMRLRLHGELEQQLCAVCRDQKKAVLFFPCLHVCVCEACRGRLRPYRCPLCQEAIENHIERVHF
eukprot:TRINITY_DN19665_c0_g1_i1.p1 TRINITY_DN19665_c0_g1~~TRINITY_DN19665_c0_g1_i1.p1  ORF type:complete len:411 (-),score=106.07 TRINITY_DN19665_c0_g1_i1:54-1286(-)